MQKAHLRMPTKLMEFCWTKKNTLKLPYTDTAIPINAKCGDSYIF